MITFIYRGGGEEVIPQDATHVTIHKSVEVIDDEVFKLHSNIIEVYCHAGVEIILMHTFDKCRRMRRVVIPGVKDILDWAFHGCNAMTHIECDNLGFIGCSAFQECTSLVSINLQSVEYVEGYAFYCCEAMTEAKFGANLCKLELGVFAECRALERIVLPLKNGLLTQDNIFQGCVNLRRVDLVEAEILQEMVHALHLVEWRDDMTAEIESINQILPDADPGSCISDEYDEGQKAIVIREWMARILVKVIHYKVQHRQLLNEAATVLQLVVPNDIVVDDVIPFLELPPHSFGGENVD